MIPSIDRYILRLVIVPMLGVFALAASLLTLDKMLRLFDFVAVEGGPVGVVFKMLGALVPEYAKGGEIAERGSHSELLAQDGLYASMWNRQREATQAEEMLRQVRESDWF